MSRKVTVTKNYIDSLKAERDRFKKELAETKEDLSKHQNYWTFMFREVTKIHGRTDSAINSSWMMESMAKHFNKVKQWYWG